MHLKIEPAPMASLRELMLCYREGGLSVTHIRDKKKKVLVLSIHLWDNPYGISYTEELCVSLQSTVFVLFIESLTGHCPVKST